MDKLIEISFWDKEWDSLSNDEITVVCEHFKIKYFTNENKYVVKKMYCFKRKEALRVEKIIEDIRCTTFHMDDNQAKIVIDDYIKRFPELLKYHTKEWYYINC